MLEEEADDGLEDDKEELEGVEDRLDDDTGWLDDDTDKLEDEEERLKDKDWLEDDKDKLEDDEDLLEGDKDELEDDKDDEVTTEALVEETVELLVVDETVELLCAVLVLLFDDVVPVPLLPPPPHALKLTINKALNAHKIMRLLAIDIIFVSLFLILFKLLVFFICSGFYINPQPLTKSPSWLRVWV